MEMLTGDSYFNNAGRTYNDTRLATPTIDMHARVKPGVALVLYDGTFLFARLVSVRAK